MRIPFAPDRGAASERSFGVVVFGEAAQHDVDRALPVRHVAVADLGEDVVFGGFFDARGVGCV